MSTVTPKYKILWLNLTKSTIESMLKTTICQQKKSEEP